MDEMRSNGGTVKIDQLSEELGVPVVPISAAKNEGIDELINRAMRTAERRQLPKRQDFCSGAVHRTIHSIAHLIEDHAERAGLPMRFAATKLVEGDGPVEEMLQLSDNEKDMIQHSITEMEQELGTCLLYTSTKGDAVYGMRLLCLCMSCQASTGGNQ